MSGVENRTGEPPIESRELYALLGEFLVKFQELCFGLRVGIMFMDDNTGERDGRVTQALTIEMTAGALLKSYNAIARSMRELTEFESTVLSKIYDRAIKVIEKRNEMIHGEWFVVNREDFPYAMPPISAKSERHSKQGIRSTSLSVDAKYLHSIIDECYEVSQLVGTAWLCFMPKGDFRSSFILNQNGSLSRGPFPISDQQSL